MQNELYTCYKLVISYSMQAYVFVVFLLTALVHN